MKKYSKMLKSHEMSSSLFLVILILLVGYINPGFLQPTSILNCFNDSVVFTLLAVGSTFVILTGEIDVSVGATLGISAAVGATMLRDGSNWAVAIFVALLIGAVVGLINGFGVSFLNIPSLIFTLGVNGVVRGMIYVYTKGAWVENLPPTYTKLSNTTLFGDLTIFYAATLIVVIGIHLALTKTRRGRYFIAVGDNAAGATMVGIPVVRTKIAAYMLCGILAAAAGMIYTSRIGFITPTAGNSYEMKAIAACVLGGISLAGGQGSVIGAAIGAVLMASISRILVFLGFSSDYDSTITGILLITMVVINTVAQSRAIQKNRHQILLHRTAKTPHSVGQEGGMQQ